MEEQERVLLAAVTTARRLHEKNDPDEGLDGELGPGAQPEDWNSYPVVLDYLEDVKAGKVGGGNKTTDAALPKR